MNRSTCFLFSEPLEPDYKHTYYFEKPDEQISYFEDKAIRGLMFEDFTYIRKDNIIRVPESYDNIIDENINYVMYKNPNEFNEKWYFAFVTDVKYKAEKMTELHIETDVLQTWMFDIDIKPSFIEREHVKDDTPGAHTLEEGLELGEYVSEKRIDFIPLSNLYESNSDNLAYVVGATVLLNNSKFPKTNGGNYNGVYSGLKYFYYSDSASLDEVIQQLPKEGRAEAIHTIFMAPKQFLKAEGNKGKVTQSTYCKTMRWSDASIKLNDGSYLDQEQIYKPSKLGSYTPQNKKLLTFPFCYLNMHNNAGATALYRYEDFKKLSGLAENQLEFVISFALTPGCSIRIHPMNYKGLSENPDEGLTGAKFPICNWATDVYTNWLTQNSANMQVAMGAAVIGGVASAVTLDGHGVLNSVTNIAGQLAEKHARSFQPPQVEGNINSGDVMFSMGLSTFSAHQMRIKEEYARIIDEFFGMFGYKIHRVKRPEKNHRKHFWYTKTIDANISGGIPANDILKIKSVYNNGVTFWKNHANIGNYGLSADNVII